MGSLMVLECGVLCLSKGAITKAAQAPGPSQSLPPQRVVVVMAGGAMTATCRICIKIANKKASCHVFLQFSF